MGKELDEILRLASQSPAETYKRAGYPGELTKKGKAFVGLCPFHTETGPSFTISGATAGDNAGLWYCHGQCKEGGNILGFFQRINGATEASHEGIAKLALQLGVSTDDKPPSHTKRTKKRTGKAKHTEYEVLGWDGKQVAVHARDDFEDGEKEMWWERNGKRGLRGLPLTGLRLYGVWNLPNDLTSAVILVEGEKPVKPLGDNGFQVVGTYGSSVLPENRVLEELQGRPLFLWPDNDEAGAEHMRRIASRLKRLGTQTKIVIWAEAPPKGDAFDYFAAGGTADGVQAMMDSAKPIDLIAGLAPVATVEEVGKRMLRTQWLWQGWLPRGYLTCLAGDPGAGKSAVALRIAATVTSTLPWPDGEPFLEPTPVLWLECEGAQALVCERVVTWGLDGSRLLFPGQEGLEQVMLDQPGLFAQWAENAVERGASLIVVDSLRAAHKGDENSSDMIGFLTEMATAARDLNLAVLVIHHLRKRNQYESAEISLERLRGSSAIAASFRLIWALWQPDKETDVIRLEAIKSNLAALPEAIGVMVGSSGVTFSEAPEVYREPTLVDGACDLLLAHLHNHPQPVDATLQLGREKGFSDTTMWRAVRKLKLVTVKNKGTSGKLTCWSLPARQG